jgi:hypothetical protein
MSGWSQKEKSSKLITGVVATARSYMLIFGTVDTAVVGINPFRIQPTADDSKTQVMSHYQ